MDQDFLGALSCESALETLQVVVSQGSSLLRPLFSFSLVKSFLMMANFAANERPIIIQLKSATFFYKIIFNVYIVTPLQTFTQYSPLLYTKLLPIKWIVALFTARNCFPFMRPCRSWPFLVRVQFISVTYRYIYADCGYMLSACGFMATGKLPHKWPFTRKWTDASTRTPI